MKILLVVVGLAALDARASACDPTKSCDRSKPQPALVVQSAPLAIAPATTLVVSGSTPCAIATVPATPQIAHGVVTCTSLGNGTTVQTVAPLAQGGSCCVSTLSSGQNALAPVASSGTLGVTVAGSGSGSCKAVAGTAPVSTLSLATGTAAAAPSAPAAPSAAAVGDGDDDSSLGLLVERARGKRNKAKAATNGEDATQRETVERALADARRATEEARHEARASVEKALTEARAQCGDEASQKALEVAEEASRAALESANEALANVDWSRAQSAWSDQIAKLSGDLGSWSEDADGADADMDAESADANADADADAEHAAEAAEHAADSADLEARVRKLEALARERGHEISGESSLEDRVAALEKALGGSPRAAKRNSVSRSPFGSGQSSSPFYVFREQDPKARREFAEKLKGYAQNGGVYVYRDGKLERAPLGQLGKDWKGLVAPLPALPPPPAAAPVPAVPRLAVPAPERRKHALLERKPAEGSRDRAEIERLMNDLRRQADDLRREMSQLREQIQELPRDDSR